jgi:two-component system sensor histidine kinase DctS
LPPTSPTPTPPLPPDFGLLQQVAPGLGLRSRRTLWLLLGLVLLVVASVVALVLYLNAYEKSEEERRRVADGLWLEQSVRFHFSRLEDDLLVLARQSTQRTTAHVQGKRTGPSMLGGLLWNEPGAVLWHGWLAQAAAAPLDPADPFPPPITPVLNLSPWPPLWRADQATHPANGEALSSMLDIAVGLRRSAYAGPMRLADGQLSDVVWLAVPFFERGEFLGTYVAALSMNACVQGLVPDWFLQNHDVRMVTDGALPPRSRANAEPSPYMAPMNLPDTDLFMAVTAHDTQPATVPRMFLLVALLFLMGMLASLAALRRDMTKRQRVQSLLQAQVALRTAMENSVTIGLRAWTREGQILYVNEAFCRMVGYSAQELVGRVAPLPYWPPEHRDELNVVHRGIIHQGTQDEGVEVQFQHRSGRRVDVLIHEAPLTTTSGEHLGWMSSVLDISERKRAQRLAELQQDKLEASGRLVAMGEVASTLAHELNQPLGALSSFANGLLNRVRAHNISLAEVEPVVARMARLSERAGGIIQRVNAFARRRELSRQVLDLAVFLKKSATATQADHGVTLMPLPHEGALWVLADEMLLDHVVTNLIGNATDWAARGTHPPGQVRIWLDVDPTQHMAALHVADSGPGVSEDLREHIFSAFFSTKDGGMGMGLAICRSIVEAHHGRIEVSRDPDLGGARFTVWLPLSGSPCANEDTATSTATHANTPQDDAP